MKNFSLLMMFAALGIFSLGCEPAKKPSTSTPVESDHMTSDSGEERPSAPAVEPKPEAKPEEKPAEPATDPKTEETPAAPAAEPKPEEKPAVPAAEPKPEEKPADAPK